MDAPDSVVLRGMLSYSCTQDKQTSFKYKIPVANCQYAIFLNVLFISDNMSFLMWHYCIYYYHLNTF